MKRTLCLLVVALTAAAALAAPQQKKPASRMEFRPATFDMMPGETYPVELYIPNRTRRTMAAKLTYKAGNGLSVKPDRRWTGKIGRYGAKSWPKIVAGPKAKGVIPVTATVDKVGSAKLTIRIVEPTLKVTPGLFQVAVVIANPFRERKLKGRIIASNPDRFLQDITTREFFILPGKKARLVFPCPGAAPVETETYDFTFEIHGYAGYRSVRKYALEFPSHSKVFPRK